MIHDKSIVVGACDWDHPQWQNNFYPHDLPADWRLSYYANEFLAVLVPQEKWQAENVDFEQWAEDAPQGFRFYFFSSAAGEVDVILTSQIKKYLGAAFAGFVPANGSAQVALIDCNSKTLREWKDWLLVTDVSTIFLVDTNLTTKKLVEFQSLVELMGL